MHKKRILFIHHCRDRGGASKSLFVYIPEIAKKFKPIILLPRGKVSDEIKTKFEAKVVKGIPQFDNSEIGRYEGRRWLVLFRELFFLFPALLGLVYLKRKFPNVACIHVNEASLVLIGVLAKLIFKTRLVVHARTMQSKVKNFRSRILGYLIRKNVDHIVAIDNSVAASLDIYKPKRGQLTVVRNSISLKAKKRIHQLEYMNVGIVANFLEYKGILDFYNAAKYIISRNVNDIRFVFFGDNHRSTESFSGRLFQVTGFMNDLKGKIQKDISDNALEKFFKFYGFTNSLHDIYNSIDILCFPSHLNAIGRPVIEAAFYKVPSIACLRDSDLNNDYIIDGKSGFIALERNPEDLAAKILKFSNDKNLISTMGNSAFKLANENFSFAKNSSEFLEIFMKYTDN